MRPITDPWGTPNSFRISGLLKLTEHTRTDGKMSSNTIHYPERQTQFCTLIRCYDQPYQMQHSCQGWTVTSNYQLPCPESDLLFLENRPAELKYSTDCLATIFSSNLDGNCKLDVGLKLPALPSSRKYLTFLEPLF